MTRHRLDAKPSRRTEASRLAQARVLLRLRATPGVRVPVPVLVAQIFDDDYRAPSKADRDVVYQTVRRLRSIGLRVRRAPGGGYMLVGSVPTKTQGTGI